MLEKIASTWNEVENQYLDKFAGKLSREDYFKKMVMWKNGNHNIPLIMSKLKPEVASFNDEQLSLYSVLIQVLESVKYVLDNKGFPSHINNLDEYIRSCVQDKMNSSEKVHKVLSDDVFINLAPNRIVRSEVITYSPLEIFNKYGVFGSVYTSSHCMRLNRKDLYDVCIIENNEHLDELLSYPMSNTLARIIKHCKELNNRDDLKFNVAYIMPTMWEQTKKGFELKVTYKNNPIKVAPRYVEYVDTEYSKYYKTFLRMNGVTQEAHLLV
ncbi:hypothetical protein [uncultured Clostridium sp.]|uniref:hypothetical protein n=1 Tax=uncultured Clostridium sp. TaxID=59620 RepID=UPI0026F3E42C|nr:hypothetical protein [uncultured Clostridium sp.]